MTTFNLDNVDITEFDTLIGSDTDDSVSIAPKTVVSEAFKVNPERHARKKQVSNQIQIPTSSLDDVKVNQFEQSMKLDKLQLDTVPQRSPKVADWLTEFDNAAIAQNDIPTLEKLESLFTPVADVVRSVPGGTLQGLGSSIQGAGELFNAGSRMVDRGIRSITGDEFIDDADRVVHNFFNLLLPESLERDESYINGLGLNYAGELIKNDASMIGAPSDRSNIATEIASGVGQVAGQILTSMINPSLAVSGMFTMGVDQQAENQKQTGTLGQDALSDAALFGGGAITAVTEKIGLDKLLDRIPPSIKNNIIRNVTDVAIAGGIEAVQEISENILHGLLEQTTTNEDAEIFKDLDRTAIVSGGTGAIVRGLINMVTPGRVRSLSNHNDEIIQQSDQDQTKIDSLESIVSEITMVENSPELLNQLIEKIEAGQNTHVFLDGAQTQMYLNENRDTNDVAIELIRDSISDNGDIAIPIADFATHMIGTDHFTELRDFMTMREDSIAPFRREDHDREIKQQMTELIKESQVNSSMYAESQDVANSVRDQLIDSGTMNVKQAADASQLAAQWAVQHAKNNDITVQEAWKLNGIVGPHTGALDTTDGDILNQSVYHQSQDFGNVEVSERVKVAETGQMVTVTESAQKVFDKHYKDRSNLVRLRDCINK